MKVKVLEGESLENLIEKAKTELGEQIEILYYEVEKKGFIPPFRKKKYRLYVAINGKKETIKRTVEEIKKVEEDIEEIKSLIKELKVTAIEQKKKSIPVVNTVPEHIEKNEVPLSPSFLEEFTGDALELIRTLVKRGVKPEVAVEIIRESCGIDIETEKFDLNTATFKEALVKGVEKKISFTGEFKAKKGEKSVYAFVGPTGVGKTTNLFKIASKFVLNDQVKVGVITTDTFKVGAIQQVKEYAYVLNIPYFVVSDSKKLQETIEKVENLDVILIDTVGRSHYDYWRLGEIKVVLSGLRVPINVVLLVSCNYEPSEAIEVVNRYRSFFPISSIFFTKIDEASKPGSLLNVPLVTELPVSYVSTGQRVPEDIKLLTPELVADYLLGR
jgi:flagellar biosynthesis protein FlhF